MNVFFIVPRLHHKHGRTKNPVSTGFFACTTVPKVDYFAYTTPLSTFVHAVLRGEGNFSVSLGGIGQKPKAVRGGTGSGFRRRGDENRSDRGIFCGTAANSQRRAAAFRR